MAFLPVTRKEMEERGWDQCDFVYVCGDAYVDHSSFGMAIITRLLEANGYKVGIIAQPDWHDPASIYVRGKHGFDGVPLYGCKKTPQSRFLFPWWADGLASRPCISGLRQSNSAHL